MPYKIKGNTVIKADTGEVVGHSTNPKKYLKILQAVEHGFRPTGKKKKKKSTKHSKEAFVRAMNSWQILKLVIKLN